MKKYLPAIVCLLSLTAVGQEAERPAATPVPFIATFQPNSLIATLSAGFLDPNRKDFSLPVNYRHHNTSGYNLIYGKLEYALSRRVGIAANFCYDAFVFNYSRVYNAFGSEYLRHATDRYRLFGAGVTGYYHLGDVIKVKRLDPFVGLGISLNNVRHSGMVQGDSTVVSVSHTTDAYLKAGARYYISQRFSLFADIGYDRKSVFSVGASCLFPHSREMSNEQVH